MEEAPHQSEGSSKSEDALVPPKNAKEWFTNALVGLFVGIAVIVPGISGATIAIIFKIYDKMLSAVSNLFKKFKPSALFLLPLVLGALVGFAGGFFGVQAALSFIPFAIICLFAGLMTGAFPAVSDEIKGAEKTPLRWALLLSGFLLPILLSALVTLLSGGGNASAFSTVDGWEYPVFLLVGFAIAITQVIPGLSASAFLMMIGYFTALVDTVHLEYIRANPAIFGIYACLLIGFLVGFFLTSKGLNYLLKEKRKTTFFPIVGLSAGAIVSIFFNPDIYELYQIWGGADKAGTSYAQSVPLSIDIPLGVVLFLSAFALSFFLYRYQKKHGEVPLG